MGKYEYRVEANLTLEELNKIGKEMWELVAVIMESKERLDIQQKREKFIFYFKRKLL